MHKAVARAIDLPGAAWVKSSYSGSDQSQCVEVADVRQPLGRIAVRDSKDPAAPHSSSPLTSSRRSPTSPQNSRSDHPVRDCGADSCRVGPTVVLRAARAPIFQLACAR